jgi:hypothetical protein
MNDQIHYDIIADIHGRFDKFNALMERLGYNEAGEGFIPPAGHKALFLGDLLDTKPGHTFPGGVRATLRAVKAMCDRGDALCLMGNHEWNAILFHSADPDGEPLKANTPRNTRTHQGTLDDFPDHADPAGDWRRVWLPWLKALPISLDLGGFRAVHACWHAELLEILEGRSPIDDDFLLICADKGTPENKAIDAVLKGIEVPLPDPHFFTDHTGTKRNMFRARWWEVPDEATTCRDLVFPACDDILPVPVTPAARSLFSPYPVDAPPVFCGHFFKPAHSPAHPERHNVACLDHSAATGGPLVAYRWKGESRIKPDHYVLQS